MLDIARCIEQLLPGATYSGAFENNTQQEYDNLIWTDARIKPTWAEIQAVALEISPPDNDFDPQTEFLDYTQIPAATPTRLGGVKIGAGMVVTPEGEISVPSAHIQIHGLLSTDHTVSGLTPGHFLKALAGNSFGFAEHGLTFSDVGAAPANHTHAQYSLVNHNHDDVYALIGHNHDAFYAPLVHDHDALYAPIDKGVTGGDSHDHTNGAGAQINHSSLSNLLADAHTQYSRVDGSRPFTNPIGGVDPILPDHLTTKSYVDGLLGANDAMIFKGVIDCSLSPNYPEASTGHTYKVSVAGKIGGVNGVAVEVGDTLICAVDSVAGTQAAVGNNWTILQSNIDGAVVGPTSSVDGNIVVFDSASGKLVKDIGLVASSVVTLNAAQTLANKTLTQPVITNFTSATHDHSDNLTGGQISHHSLASIGPNDHHNEVHSLTSAVHTVSGLTTGQFLKAMSPTSFGFTNHGLTYADVDAASATHNHDGIYASIDHEHDLLYAPIVHNHDTMYAPISHGLISSSHTVSGLSTGTFLKALSPTSFGFASHGLTYLDVDAASANHNHDDVYSLLSHNHDIAYAFKIHNHDGVYAPLIHNHDTVYAPMSHNLLTSHTVSGLTSGQFLKALTANTFGFADHGLTFSDVGAASASHNHDSAYAPLGHNHDTVYAPIAMGVTNGNDHDHYGGDGAQIDHAYLANLTVGDPHTQYMLANGSKAFTGTVIGVDPLLPMHLATKNYVDTIMEANDAMVFKGVLDCSTNPNYPAGSAGYTYKVSVSGKIGGANGAPVEVGDLIICITDGSAPGDQATVGMNWSVIQSNLDGAVIGPESSITGNLASFNSMTGKLIADSGIAVDSVVTLAAAQVLTNKTLVTPTIGSFVNATHDHSDAAHGGKIAHSSLDSIGPNDHHAQAHGLVSSDHTVSGLTSGQFLKALTATSFGFAPHGLTYTDVNAASATHNHDAAYAPLGHNHDTVYYTKTELLAANGQHNKIDWSQIANAPASYALPTASSTVLGGVKVGAGLAIDAGGILSATYSLPMASASVLGGVKVGNGLAIDAAGSLSVTANAVYQYSRLDSPSLIVLKDLRATGVNGGTLTGGGWRTRIVNTLENPFACTWITLANNRFTLAAGRYEVEMDISGCHLTGAIARLQSTSGDTISMLSTPTYANSDTETDNLIAGVFELTQTTEFEIQHYCTSTRNTDGMGRALNIAGIQEQYLLARIWRLR